MFRRSRVTTLQEWLGETLVEDSTLRVGWPDDAVELRLKDADEIKAALRDCIERFRAYWEQANLVIDMSVNRPSVETRRLRRRLALNPFTTPSWIVWLASWIPLLEERPRGPCVDIKIVRITHEPQDYSEAAHAAEGEHQQRVKVIIRELAELARASGGGTYVHWGASGFGLRLPLSRDVAGNATREHSPELRGVSWDDQYAEKLERTSWESLRHETYRFADEAERIAEWCVANGKSSVLIPSSGLCVHPWQFADRGLDVIATDVSRAALAAVRAPEQLTRVYGAGAKRRWETSECADYGGAWREGFRQMPEIADSDVAERLRRRIVFAVADWAALPLPDDSVDVVFATNALPRGNVASRAMVLLEWARVTRPGGVVFIHMHNGYSKDVAEFFNDPGWQRVNALAGQAPTEGRRGYQEMYSSG